MLTRSLSQLERFFETYPKTRLLIVHRDAFAALDGDFLQQQYDQGVVLASINAPISILNAHLKNVHVAIPDLSMENVESGEFLMLSVFQSFTSGRRYFSDYYQSETQLLSVLCWSVSQAQAGSMGIYGSHDCRHNRRH